jgi:hypothetical protein
MVTEKQFAVNYASPRKSIATGAEINRLSLGERHNLLPLYGKKNNLNKPTHFDDAIKGLTARESNSKPIYNPSKAA